MGVPLDGEAIFVYDADGVGSAVDIGTATTSIDPYIYRIKRDIHAPEPNIIPIIYDVLRDFAEKTWILFMSFRVQGHGVEASAYKSVTFDIDTVMPGLVPMRVHRFKDQAGEYAAVQRDIKDVEDIDMSVYDKPGVKFYNFFTDDDATDSYYLRVFPFSYDPLLFVNMAFRLPDRDGMPFDAAANPLSIPRVLLDYKEEICSGVMARMMMQPGAEWTNPQLAGFRDTIYQIGISRAKLRWFKNNSVDVAVSGRGLFA